MKSRIANLSADEVLAECCRDGRICPQPSRWNELWQMLPNKQQHGARWEPPLPLILAAWHESSSASKRTRLEEHIKWAHAQGALDVVYRFLSSLSDDDWHYESRSTSSGLRLR